VSQLYFAYGSNLWIQQMERRCPSSRVVGAGRLVDHRLTFFGERSGWGPGGVADGAPAPGQVLYGAVYSLPDHDLRALDDHEDQYTRALRVVELPTGSVEAWVYRRAIDQGFNAPSPRYLSAIAFGYGQHGLDLSVLWEALSPD